MGSAQETGTQMNSIWNSQLQTKMKQDSDIRSRTIQAIPVDHVDRWFTMDHRGDMPRLSHLHAHEHQRWQVLLASLKQADTVGIMLREPEGDSPCLEIECRLQDKYEFLVCDSHGIGPEVHGLVNETK